MNGTGSGQTWDPKWECFVDGASFGSTKPFLYTENNWLLCQGTQLSDGDHTLTVKVTTMGSTFWVDQLRFTPSSGASSGSGTVLFVDRNDPTVDYGSGWTHLGDSAEMTTTRGSQLTLSFTGKPFSCLLFLFLKPHSPYHQFLLFQERPSVGSVTYRLNSHTTPLQLNTPSMVVPPSRSSSTGFHHPRRRQSTTDSSSRRPVSHPGNTPSSSPTSAAPPSRPLSSPTFTSPVHPPPPPAAVPNQA